MIEVPKMRYSFFYPLLLYLYITLLEYTGITTIKGSVLGMSSSTNQTCCNGILGYAVPNDTMPCSDMRCCNHSEVVALQQVNHALGFCFRCVPQTAFESETRCYENGESVASTFNNTIEYSLKTCCQGLKFSVFMYTEDDIAMTIKCVQR